jgi:dipeptidyl aminopeptidase/acylaminoacyl peptidase
MGVDPKKNVKAFDRYRPEQNVSRSYPPTILFHGTADTDVPYSQSAAMAHALESAGAIYEFMTIPDGPHGFDSRARIEDLDAPEQSLAVRSFIRAIAFINRYT